MNMKTINGFNFLQETKLFNIKFTGQDTHFTPEIEPYIETQWGYKCIFN